MSIDNDLPVIEKLAVDSYEWIKKIGISQDEAFGLDENNVVIEKFPIIISPPKEIKLNRVYNTEGRGSKPI
jgi:KUP system potassium uptake protein